MPEPPPSPTATYRLQFRREFPLAAAREQVPYFAALGLSHLYASPLLEARRGSTHGYDLTNPTRLNPELGDASELEQLAAALRAAGMGLLLDIVPNHMAADLDNPWWRDVLARGAASPQAPWFDVNWRNGHVVLPILPRSLPAMAQAGELRVVPGDDGPMLQAGALRFPLAPRSRERLPGRGGDWAGLNRQPARLVRLAREQSYRLTHWRAANREINYRRFFAINDLVGFRVELPDAFAAAHALVRQWMRAGWVHGLRIDHIDGLHDPLQYLRRLVELEPLGEDPAPLLVEKILAREESLPIEWPVAGTTGYEMIASLDRLQTPAAGLDGLLETYRGFIRRRVEFADVAYGKKRQAIRGQFAAELRGLGARVAALARRSGAAPAALRAEREATACLVELGACYPVYRTYAAGREMTAAERERVRQAAAEAARRNPGRAAAAFAWLAQLLGGEAACGLGDDAADWPGLVMRWQQYTAPIMAKGYEDAALYVFVPLASLNEVGGDPGPGGRGAAEFHRRMRIRQRLTPGALNPLSTHDTKRSGDVRARLNVLAEMPAEWRLRLRGWARLNRSLRRRGAPSRNAEYLFYQTAAGAWPMELLPAAPAAEAAAFRERISQYMLKAAREAKVETRWTAPNAGYEAALTGFVAAALDPGAAFFAEMQQFAQRLAPAGALNSLAQVLLQCLAPGVPDIYQGGELWDFSLVDPDNRRPVDFALRRRRLGELEALGNGRATLDRWREGLPKLFLTSRLLRQRRAHPALFQQGEYLPLEPAGARAAHVIAFARHGGGEWCVAVAPILLAEAVLGRAPDLAAVAWDDTRIHLPAGAPRAWLNRLSGRQHATAGDELAIGPLLRDFPVAMLEPA